MSHVGAGGAWKEWKAGSGGTGTAVGVSGAWKSFKGAWVGAGGAWKQFFQAAFPQLAALSDPLASVRLAGSGVRPIVSVRFNPDGTIDEATGDTGSALSYSQVGTWLNITPPDNAADWAIRAVVDSESANGTWTGSARGSFLTLDSARTFTWTEDDTITGIVQSDLTHTLRQVSDTSNSTTRSAVTYYAELSF